MLYSIFVTSDSYVFVVLDTIKMGFFGLSIVGGPQDAHGGIGNALSPSISCTCNIQQLTGENASCLSP